MFLQDVLSNVLSNPSGKFGFHLLRQFDGFSVNFNNYVNYAVQDVEPLLIACLCQESNASSCPPTQRTQNGLLCNAFKSFGKCLTSVGDTITKLVKGNKTNFVFGTTISRGSGGGNK